MKNKSMKISLVLLLLVALGSISFAAGTNYSQDVQVKNANPSPVDAVTGSSVKQFSTDETNSRVDDYFNQDDQVNIDPKDGLVKVLRTNQKININDYVPKLIPVKNVKPRELRVIAREIAALEGGTAEVFIDPKTKENAIYVVVPRFQLPYVVDAIQNLDEEWVNCTDDGTVVETYYAKYRDVRGVDRLASAAITRDYVEQTAFDINKNAVTVIEDAVQMKAYLKYANMVDVPANEITVEAQFIEVDLSNDQKIGLDYINWKNGPGRNLFEFIYGGVNTSEHFKGASSIFNPLTPDVAADNDGDYTHFETTGRQKYVNFNFYATAAYLDFLQSKGKAKVLVAPTLQTRSARLAQWSSIDPVAAITVAGTNDKVLYNKDNSRSTVDGARTGDSGDLGAWNRFVNYTNINTQRAGVFLDILPFVGKESTEMFINASIASNTGVTPRGLPILARRAVTADVRTKDGQMLVLGGLERVEKVKTKNGMPWLSEIPVLGYLFGGETSINRKSTVVVTLNTITTIGTESKMEIPVDMAKAIETVESPDMPQVPESPFGFDQWLLDKDNREEVIEVSENNTVPALDAKAPETVNKDVEKK